MNMCFWVGRADREALAPGSYVEEQSTSRHGVSWATTQQARTAEVQNDFIRLEG